MRGRLVGSALALDSEPEAHRCRTVVIDIDGDAGSTWVNILSPGRGA